MARALATLGLVAVVLGAAGGPVSAQSPPASGEPTHPPAEQPAPPPAEQPAPATPAPAPVEPRAPTPPEPVEPERLPTVGERLDRGADSGWRRRLRYRAPEPRKPREVPGRRGAVQAPGGALQAPGGAFDALPGPSFQTGVPNFVIRKFRVPIFLLPIYQAAGIEYGIRWEILAAINEIETDYGRNLNVSSAGALGWMQFMPSTWEMYGTDANKDGRKDPYNPVDAIFAAARYLNAAGYEDDIRRAIFAYNHADWYVDSVLLRARLIAGVPADLVGSLTGLTEGRFPVAAGARYAGAPDERGIELLARARARVVAVNDGVVKKHGRSRRLGRYLVLQDVYGNRYTYANLGEVAKHYPVPRQAASGAVHARQPETPAPTEPASAGRQLPSASSTKRPVKLRLFAQPAAATRRPRPFGPDAKDVRLSGLHVGSRVIGGTVLGKATRLRFEIRPAGRGTPRIDPKPILDGWRLLEATAIYRAAGRNMLHGNGSIGQILLLPTRLLERRVLSDQRIEIYDCGRSDIRSGQIDRRVLASLAYLAESGLRPTVTSLKCGHGFYTASGNVSEHSSGNAVDIAKVNNVPILGHQEPGGITDQAVRRLLRLQGTLRPHQIISLLEPGGPTLAMADHADHIHVGFEQLFGPNAKLGRQARAVLKPGQWSTLLARLREIDNPVVPTGSRAAP